jgi:DNA-binding transcriptional ArsR family regulator
MIARLAENAPVFAALGDATRLRIVVRLCQEGPLSIARLAQGAKVSRQAIAKHLQVLEAAGVARGFRTGRESIWELRSDQLLQVQRYVLQISRDWDAALNRLRKFVEQSEQ